MAKARALVGLDVHAAKVVAAILDAETGELRLQRLGGESRPVVELCESLAGPVRATYEAGPTGYGLARALEAAGVSCVVAAPGKISRGATDKLKTDRRDAEHLVRLLMAGKLHPVRVPGPAEEALRDLVRAHEDVRQDLMRARHRLSKLLLRHEVRFEGRAWTERHRVWLAKVELGHAPAQATFVDYLGAIGDFERFARAGQLMSYLGLVPSEHSTGESRRLGSITRSGSRHARRLLVEAAWHYRNPPRVGREIERRQEGQPAEATAIAWSAQRRLHRTWTRMRARNKRPTVTTVAVARELAGFCWAVALIE